MSILIKGMEMPEHCGYCRFRYDGICHALQKTQYNMEDCPLVPVSPHGRCIDVDALIKELTLNDEDDNSGASLLMAIFIEVLKAAPTIIPAEEPSGDSGMLEG